MLAVAIGGYLLCSFFFAGLKGYYWSTRELGPFQQYLDQLQASVPSDASVLLLLPERLRYEVESIYVCSRLCPRPVYLLPLGVDSLAGARDWIAQKKITWVISLGGERYDPRGAYFKRLDDLR